MGMGGTGGPSRSQIIAEAKRQIRDLEGRIAVTQDSITTLETAVTITELDSRQERIERMLEAIINVQLTTLRGHMTEGTVKLEEMRAGVAKAESPIQTSGQMPVPHKRF